MSMSMSGAIRFGAQESAWMSSCNSSGRAPVRAGNHRRSPTHGISWRARADDSVVRWRCVERSGNAPGRSTLSERRRGSWGEAAFPGYGLWIDGTCSVLLQRLRLLTASRSSKTSCRSSDSLRSVTSRLTTTFGASEPLTGRRARDSDVRGDGRVPRALHKIPKPASPALSPERSARSRFSYRHNADNVPVGESWFRIAAESR